MSLSRRHRQFFSPLGLAATVALALALLYVVGWPVIETIARRAGWIAAPRFAPTPLAQQFMYRLFELAVYAWIFFVGASVGSFLNVVIYRVPRGRTLLGTSHCPYCRAAIRPRDNVPVFGWLALRGRCRKCRLPIAARYPIVEFLAGAMLLALAHCELFAGRDASWMVRHLDGSQVVRCLHHFVLLSILLSWTYIRYDHHRLPASYVVLAIFSGIAIAAVWPAVHTARLPIFNEPLLPDGFGASRAINNLVHRFGGSAAGMGIGFVVGVLWRLGAGGNRTHERNHATATEGIAIWSTIGVFVGPQSLLWIALLTGGLWLVAAWASLGIRRLREFPPLAWVTIATLLYFCLANRLESLLEMQT